MTVEKSREIPPARSLTDTRTVRRRNNSNRAGWLAGVTLAAIAAFEGGLLFSNNNSSTNGTADGPRATDSATPRPSEALATASPVVSSSPEATHSATASPVVSSSPEATHSAIGSPEWANPINIETAQAAATRYGADAYSSDPSNWEINEWGGAHLKETEKAVKVNTAGAVVEGWLKAKMIGANDALTFVADPSVTTVELNGGTFWDFGTNSEAGFAQVLKQVQDKEPVEQPGVTVIPLCADLESINTVDVQVNMIESAQEAATRFGADAYSSDPSNWEINEWGGAHLKETAVASLVNLDGATFETWIKAPRVNGRDAVTFVVHSNVGQMRSDGGTMWDFVDPNRGFQQLLGQVLAKEAIEQPDVTVYPSYDCTLVR